MDIGEAKEYIKMIIRKQEIPDSAKALGYVYATEAIETVLNELEKKDNMYIKEYNEHMEKKRQNGVLINNERILKMELEKKDKVINEMALYIKKPYRIIAFGSRQPKVQLIKEYFTNKAENVGE